MTDATRAHVIIHGKVQGVFFRMNTRHAAERVGVNGWVRNRSDGTVEAVFEGAKAVVDEMLEWCRTGDPPARVDDVEVSWEEAAGEYSEFGIRR